MLFTRLYSENRTNLIAVKEYATQLAESVEKTVVDLLTVDHSRCVGVEHLPCTEVTQEFILHVPCAAETKTVTMHSSEKKLKSNLSDDTISEVVTFRSHQPALVAGSIPSDLLGLFQGEETVTYADCSPATPLVSWFWSAVRALPADRQTALGRLCTRVDMDAPYSALRIQSCATPVEADSLLPIISPHAIRLPRYSCKSVAEARLTQLLASRAEVA